LNITCIGSSKRIQPKRRMMREMEVKKLKPGMAEHLCNPSTHEAEAGRA
jgi:hypothetical protein